MKEAQSLVQTLTDLGTQLGVDSQALISYAAEDTIGGFHFDMDKRKWTVGSMWEVEAQTVYALVRALRPDRVLECGVGNACTTTHILTALEANDHGELISLDPEPYSGDLPWDNSRWTFNRQDAVAWLRAHPDDHFDMVIEDAMHDYPLVYSILALVKGRHPRIVLSHDAEHYIVGPDVQRAWTDVYGSFQTALTEPSDCGFAWIIDSAWTPQPIVPVKHDPIEIIPGRERILYLPIIEPGDNHETALLNKRGLRDALSAYGDVRQLDYLAIDQAELYRAVRVAIDDFQPSLLLTQLHGVDRLTPDNLRAIRADYPTLRIVNWSGDSWSHGLTSPEILDLASTFDLQLVAAPDVLPIYAEHGINAGFWQIAYEAPVGELPDMPSYDVVFLGNIISDERRKMLEFLSSLEDVSVGIYGDWEHSDGRNTYNFGAGEALYRGAKIAIADNVYPDQQNYVSNRPIQALVAGGALLLHQRVPKMAELLGIEAGTHYVEWTDFADLETQIRKYLKAGNEPRRRKMVKAGQEYALDHHLYSNRAKQLFEELLPEVSRVA